MKNISFFLLATLCLFSSGFAANGGEDSLVVPAPQKVKEVFYGTRAVNFHTVEQVGHRVLAYRISHRFGTLRRDQLYNFLGLDGPGNISFMFDYGIRDNLMVGIGRDQQNKTYNAYTKYNVLQQKTSGMPLTLSLVGKANIISERDDQRGNAVGRYDNFAHRMSYVTQILIARKFGERFALQLAPTWVHHNLVEASADKNDIFALAGTAQYKIGKRLGISAEYSYGFGDYAVNRDRLFSSASVGLDVVTGGHIFQIVLVNSTAINEAWAIPFTRSDWLQGDFRIGFNISRNFWL